MRKSVHLATSSNPGFQLRRATALRGRLARPPLPGSPHASVLHRQTTMRFGHRDQPTQHCRPQHMVVCADPIHFQNGGPVIVVGCRPQHVPHAICPTSRGQCVLEWGTFFLKVFRKLPRQQPRDQPTECASSGNSSHTSVVLGQCSQPGAHQRSLDVNWNTPLCDTGRCLEDKVEHIHLIHEDFQMLACPTPWTKR